MQTVEDNFVKNSLVEMITLFILALTIRFVGVGEVELRLTKCLVTFHYNPEIPAFK